MVDVNIKGVLNGVAAVLPTFVEQKSGHVITTSSVAGLKAYPGGAVYGGTKWFVRDFMEVLRMESAQEGTNIRTATIYPAAINTELLGYDLARGYSRRHGREFTTSTASRRIALQVLWLLPSISWKTPPSASSPSVRLHSLGRNEERIENMNIQKNGSQPSAKGPPDWFTGTVRLDAPFQRTGDARIRGAIGHL